MLPGSQQQQQGESSVCANSMQQGTNAHLDLLGGQHVPVLLQGALGDLLEVNQDLGVVCFVCMSVLSAVRESMHADMRAAPFAARTGPLLQQPPPPPTAQIRTHLVGVVGHDAQRVDVRQGVSLGLDVLLDQVVLALVGQDHVRLARAEAADVGAKHDAVGAAGREERSGGSELFST